MKIQIKLFAVARQLADRDSIELEVDDTATIGDVRSVLAARIPPLAPWLDKMLFAVDAQYANDQTRISAASDVACIPPVSGG